MGYQDLRILIDALEKIAKRGCKITRSGQPKGTTCIEFKKKLQLSSEGYDKTKIAKVLSGDNLCVTCTAQYALEQYRGNSK